MPLLNETFHYDILPGNKSELYGVIPTNFNIAICKYISKERKENAIKVLKILTSKEMQKHIMLSYDKYESYDLIKVISGISSLYDDNDVCEKVDCNFIKRLRFTTMPVFKEDKYYLWSKYFRNKIYEFLYGNGTVSEILKEINEEKKSFINSGNRLTLSKLIYFYNFLIILSFMLK